MSEQFTEFTEAEWSDASEDFQADAEIDWDHEANLREVIGEPTGPVEADNLEDADEQVLDEVIQGFRDRSGKEAERLAEVTLADCYIVLCFATRAQREAYLQATGWSTIGRRYIDGRRVAAKEGIDLPPDPEWPQSKRDHTWDSFAMTVEENEALPE